MEINPIGLGRPPHGTASFPLFLLWAGQRRMRPGTPSSGGRSVGRRAADAWFPPFTRFARCGRCGVEKMPSKSSKLATPLFPFSTFKLLILSAFTFCSRPLNLRDTISVRSPGLHSFSLCASHFRGFTQNREKCLVKYNRPLTGPVSLPRT